MQGSTLPSSMHRNRRKNGVISHSVVVRNDKFWVDHEEFLRGQGYTLRPLGHATGGICGDMDNGVPSDHAKEGSLLAATCIRTGEAVLLKRVLRIRCRYEDDILREFSGDLASHPENHCVPLIDILELPDSAPEKIIVMPLLRPHHDLPIRTVQDAIEFLKQVFEGLQFMHQNNIAHRNCTGVNIMFDPRSTHSDTLRQQSCSRMTVINGRIERTPRYYFVSLGLAIRMDPAAGDTMVIPAEADDESVPEFHSSKRWDLHDPFATDVYYIGNMIQQDFFRKTRQLDFLKPLVDDMVQMEPKDRPKMDEVIQRFQCIVGKLTWWSLAAKLEPSTNSLISRFALLLHYLADIWGSRNILRFVIFISQRIDTLTLQISFIRWWSLVQSFKGVFVVS